MERINEYRQQVQAFLQDFSTGNDEAQLIFDTERDHYLVMHNAWHGEHRTYGCAMQIDVIDGKIWIQHNSTEVEIDRELIERGISNQDIVLGFRSPSVRSLLAHINN